MLEKNLTHFKKLPSSFYLKNEDFKKPQNGLIFGLFLLANLQQENSKLVQSDNTAHRLISLCYQSPTRRSPNQLAKCMSLLKCKIGSFLASLYLRLFDTFDRKLNLLMTGFEPQISGYEAPILPTVPQPLPKAKQLFVVQSQQTVRPQIFYDRKSFTNW